ncbi:MAG: hypothetical protein INR73_20345 [Williamsia sp.]|nr:hypothetical protein [Williamsia sp.]
MNLNIACALITLTLASCHQPSTETISSSKLPLAGTWRLVTGTLIEKGDTAVTDYTKNISFIKIINDTHFAFLQHDLAKGKDSAVFVAGGGLYSLADSLYTEHLEYCNDRAWEGNDFSFAITIKNDTLVQRGVEKVESAGVDRINIETYVREKK